MLCKLSLLAFLAPLTSALILDIPQNPTSSGTITIKWTAEAGDPDKFSTFSFELINTAFNNAFAIANNVDPAAGSLTLTLPVVPVGAGYTLQAVNVGNINDVFASTGSFAIGATTASVSSTVSVSTANLSSLRASSAVTTASASKSSAVTSASVSSASATSALVSSTAPASNTGSATGSANTAGTTPFSGALSSRLGNSQAGIAAALLSVVAGAAMLAL